MTLNILLPFLITPRCMQKNRELNYRNSCTFLLLSTNLPAKHDWITPKIPSCRKTVPSRDTPGSISSHFRPHFHTLWPGRDHSRPQRPPSWPGSRWENCSSPGGCWADARPTGVPWRCRRPASATPSWATCRWRQTAGDFPPNRRRDSGRAKYNGQCWTLPRWDFEEPDPPPM